MPSKVRVRFFVPEGDNGDSKGCTRVGFTLGNDGLYDSALNGAHGTRFAGKRCHHFPCARVGAQMIFEEMRFQGA